jgi:hypothetical protein
MRNVVNNSRQSQYQIAMASALADRDAARDELFVWLRGLSPEERAKVAPEKYARLSPEQFAILLGRPLSKMSFDQACAEADSAAASLGRFGRLWPKLQGDKSGRTIKIKPPFYHALRWAGIAGLCSGLASLSAVAALPYIGSLSPVPLRPIDTTTWPQCGRLAPETDGCVYIVESGMTWPQAADWLNMPLPLLLQANQPKNTAPLAKGTALIVWRFRRPLSR